MPQPLSKLRHYRGLALGGAPPLIPEFATAVSQVIAIWADIEFHYGVITARITHADPIGTTAVFQAMVNADARREAVVRAAKAKLDPEIVAIIQATLEAAKASRRTRNEFAHHLWGFLAGKEDCVLLADPNAHAMWSAHATEAAKGGGEMPDIDLSAVMVWKLHDFETAVTEARRASDNIGSLVHVFSHPRANRTRQELLQDPQIEKLYRRFLAENTR